MATMLSALFVSASLSASPAEPVALNFPSRPPLSLHKPVYAARSNTKTVVPGRRDVVSGSVMLAFGVPLLALGTGGVIWSFANSEVGGLTIIPSVLAFIPGAILTPIGSLRVARGVRERRAVQGVYVFAPNRNTLGIGALGYF